jgi:hypothetical protein
MNPHSILWLLVPAFLVTVGAGWVLYKVVRWFL